MATADCNNEKASFQPPALPGGCLGEDVAIGEMLPLGKFHCGNTPLSGAAQLGFIGDFITPDGEPPKIVTYSDGSQVHILGGEPSTDFLAAQASEEEKVPGIFLRSRQKLDLSQKCSARELNRFLF